MEHVTIFYDPGQFAAWPFAHGLWAYPDGDVLVGFARAPCRYQEPFDVNHVTVDVPGEFVTLRSPDAGATGPEASLGRLGTHAEIDRALLSGTIADAPGDPPDWTSPDFCLTAGFGVPPDRGKHLGYVQYSRDRGHTWDGPYRNPDLGFAHVQVKPDFVVRPDGMVLLFVTVGRRDTRAEAKYPGRFGSRFVAVYASPDRGVTWRYLSCILSATPDAPFVERYYASPVQLPDGRILAALRCQLDGGNAWPELHESPDGGWSWRLVSRIADWGAPTDLVRLRDGRLVAVYSRRVPPYGIRARTSQDDGRTWDPELVLRDDGGSHDLGYPRAVELPDGRVLAAYYFNRADDEVQCQGGVRHIAATIFAP
jgi:hypothetical protein